MSGGFVRFLSAALFSALLIYGDLYLNAFGKARENMSLVLVPFRAVAALPQATFSTIGDYFGSRAALLEEKRALEEQILRDQVRLKSFDFYLQQNADLRRVMKLRERHDGSWLAANARYSISGAAGRRLLMDRGRDDGVFAGQAVVDEHGVTGQVVRVDKSTSVVGLLNAPGQWIATRVARNNLLVLLRGDGDANLAIEYVVNNADLQPGDVLAADGDLYPPGYPVAVVESLAKGTIYYVGQARPLSDVSDSSFVLIYQGE